MKIDFNQQIRDLDGEPVKNGDDDVTLADIACTVLQELDPEQIDQRTGRSTEGANEKIHRMVLAQDIYRAKASGDTVDVKTDDIVLLKRLVNASYKPLVVMRAFEILEPKTE